MANTVTVQDTDHADLKELATSFENLVVAYREFYSGSKNASTKARKFLQEIRVKTAAMRKQVQSDRAAQNAVTPAPAPAPAAPAAPAAS